MKKDLRWKAILVLAVIILAVYLSYPPSKINLGLDLSGGMHLVLQVVTDDAVSQETDLEILRLIEQLKKKGIDYTRVVKNEERIGRFTIQEFDVEKEVELRELLADDFKQGWDYTLLGNTATVTIKSNVMVYLRDQSVRQALETIGNRVNELGLTEPTIQRQGLSGERVILELPGVDDPDRVKNLIKTVALLEWKLVKAGPASSEEALLTDFGGIAPEDMEVVKGDPDREPGKFFLLTRVASVTGKDLRTAYRSTDEWNSPSVAFSLSPDGARRFSKLTSENIGKQVAIVLDGLVQSAPVVESRITDSGIIRGRYTVEQADDMALVLKAGALPASIKYLEERTIGPSLGADSIRKGLSSIVIALILILIFMVFYYKLSGLNAVAALLLNILIITAALAYFKASLTLPGIAGIILTIGMAVDANVLVFERIREELSTGKSVLSSIASGFSRAFRTILDANMTTIIAAIFLFQFGTGPLKGFAVTLIIGITASMFTALFVSRLIFDISFIKRKKREKLSI